MPDPNPTPCPPKVILHRREAREFVATQVLERIRQRRQEDPQIKLSKLRAEVITWMAQEFGVGWSTAYAYIAHALTTLEGGHPS